MLYFALSSTVVILALCYIVYVTVALRRLRTSSVAALLESLCYVDLAKIGLVARALPLEHSNVSLSAQDLILLIGGDEGLRVLCHNAGVVLQLARYLALINPDNSALAQQITQDAASVRRVAFLLLIRRKLDLWCLASPMTVRGLARLYFALSVYTTQLCVHLSDDLMLILQGWKCGTTGVSRLGSEMMVSSAQ